MIGFRRGMMAMFALATAIGAQSAFGQSPKYDDVGGIRFQVIEEQVPGHVQVTETVPQQQTSYRQQVTTENVQHQQVYHVPVTQYQVVTRLHNRWNPFSAPYWTHHYEPVTTWQQQVATVQIPVNKVAWVPETKTVQQTVTRWQPVNNTVTRRVAIGTTPVSGVPNTAMASAQPLTPNTPTATLSPVAGAPAASIASRPFGGQAMPSDPPRSAPVSGGWQRPTEAPAPSPDSRYR